MTEMAADAICTGKGKQMNHAVFQKNTTARYQSGLVTTFTGVMILVLLTLMMFFAMRVGVFEQRVSSNDMRQKLAFHAAESGIHNAKEFLRANLSLVTSDEAEALSDGTDGWLDPDGGHWRLCSDAPVDFGAEPRGQHPCYAESGDDGLRRMQMFYYVEDLSAADESLNFPVDATGSILPNETETVDVFALLCVLEVHLGDEVPVKGCITDLTDEDPEDAIITDGSFFMVTLLARGQADCNGAGADCQAEVLISDKVSNFGAAAGGNSPAVPLTVKTSFTPSGSIGIVANPNAGGVGVPGSVWMGEGYDWRLGSWQTCEMHEWYETDSIPEGVACSQVTGCKCDDRTEALTYTEGNNPPTGGIDMIEDPNFPEDLFQFYFGIPRAEYLTVKGYSQVLSSCVPLQALGEDANGIYWIEGTAGSSCMINANDIIGSPDNPVLIITAAETTSFGGGATIFGTVFATNVELENAELSLDGTGAIYGALLVEGNFTSRNAAASTFDIVWNQNVSMKAGSGGGLGRVLGGWSDFHSDWTFEQEGS